MQQHVSVGVDGKVVAVWSKLQKKKGTEMNISGPLVPNMTSAV